MVNEINLNLENYLQREIGEFGSESFDSVIKKVLNDGERAEFGGIMGKIDAVGAAIYLPRQELTIVEREMYDFVFSHPEFERAMEGLRFAEQKTLISKLGEKILPGQRILDLGCGTGLKTVYYAMNSGAKIVGLDKNPLALHLTRERAERNGVQDIELLERDLVTDIFPPSNYDLVLAINMMNESGDSKKMSVGQLKVGQKIKNVKSSLSIGGTFLVTLREVPGGEFPFEIESEMANQGFRNIVRGHIPLQNGRFLTSVEGVNNS